MNVKIHGVNQLRELTIGQQGENICRQVQVDIREWAEEYPTATFHILFKRPGDTTPYPVETDVADGVLTWTVGNADVAIGGMGYTEVWAVGTDSSDTSTWADSLLRKTRIIPTVVHPCISGTIGETPEPVDNWAQGILAAAGTAQTARDAALDAQAAAETAQGKAEDAQEAAETAQGKAEDAQEAAETAQGKAEDAQEAAEAAQAAAEYAQGKAEDAQDDAETAAAAAAGSALDAAGAAATAVAGKLSPEEVLLAQRFTEGVELGTLTVRNTATKLYAQPALSSQIMPIYIGDYLCDTVNTGSATKYMPGCCVKVGSYIYTFNSALGSAHSNTGQIRRFDLANNVEDVAWRKTGLIGHANSCAYDSENGVVYVVPLMDYEAQESTPALYLYTYDATDFSYLGTVTTPTSVQAVSYDPVAQKLYYYGYHGRIYVRDTEAADGWTVICWIKTDNLSLAPRPNSHTFDQDFAVYNGRWYLSSAHGNVCTGLVYGANPAIPETGWTIAKLDSTARLYLGEPEGMEFTADGHLIALDFVQILTGLYDTFVVELPVGTVPPYAPMIGEADQYHDGTLTLSEATQTKFGLWTYEIRSLAQMEVRFLKANSSVIQIPDENTVVDPYKIRMNDAIKIMLYGEYSCEQLNVIHGYVNIQAMKSTSQLTLTTASEDPIMLRHASRLAFTGDDASRLNVNVPNKANWNGTNFVSIGYDFPVMCVRKALYPVQENVKLRVAGTPILSDIFYMGSYPLYCPKLIFASRTWYTNSYVTQTDWTENNNCIIQGWHTGVARLNIAISSPLPSDGTEVFIGRFTTQASASGNHFDYTMSEVVAAQDGVNPNIRLTFYNSGYISLKCYGTMTCSASEKAWYRVSLPVIPMNNWWGNTDIFN